MRISTAIAGLLLCSVPATASIGTTKVTPFDLLDDGSVVVPVTIGGTGHYRFVLDTGSSRTVIPTRVWHTLRLPVLAETLMVTPAGRDVAFVVRLNGIAIGARPGVNVEAAVTDAERYAAGRQVDGLIGQDVLASMVYTIDYQHRAVIWHEPGEPLAGARLPLTIRDHRVLVTLAQQAGDSRPLTLIPDSGSDSLVLFTHATDRLRLTRWDVGVLSSVSGSRAVRRVRVDTLRIGETRWQNPLVTVVDSDEFAALMGDGLLPLHVFSRVTFNVPEGYLLVQAR